jgi:hypothetical protein
MANNPNDTSLEKARKTLVAEILQLREKERQTLEKGQQITKEEVNNLSAKVKLLGKIVGLVNSENEGLKEIKQNYTNAEAGINSMTSMQEKLKEELKETLKVNLEWSDSIGNSSSKQKDGFEKAATAAAGAIQSISELAGLNKEDVAAIAEKNQEIDNQLAAMASQITIAEGLLDNRTKTSKIDKAIIAALYQQMEGLSSMKEEAGKYANISKETKELYEELNEDLEGINKTLKKITTTGEIFFGSKRGMLGMSLIAAGEFLEKMHEIGREVGYGMTEMVGFKTQVMLASMLLNEAAGESVVELGKELGNVHHQTFGMSTDVAVLSYHLNLSGQEAAYLSTAFGELQGQSWQTGMNMVEYGTHLAKAKGVMPSQAMKDVAQNSEFLAKFTKDGGKNIMDAAVAAGSLGVNLGTAEKMADSLLDYQSSIDAEMEASALLGRNLNLSKARELMYQGKIAEGMEAALEAAGGIEGWSEMDYYQKRLTAKALGVSEGEMQKMVAHQENLNGKNGVAAEIYERSSAVWHTIVDSMAGKGLKAMGGLVLSGAQLGGHLSMMGIKVPALTNALTLMMKPINGIIGGLVSMVSWIGKGIAKMIGLKVAQSSTDIGSMAGPLTKAGLPDKRFKANKTPGESVSNKMDDNKTPSKFGDGINGPALIKAAIAMLIIAGALFVFAKALQEFNSVDFDKAWRGVALLVGLGVATAILGNFAGLLLIGALALVAVSVALLIFGVAIGVVGAGMIFLGKGLQSIATGINDLDVGKLALFGLALIPLALGLAFFGLFAGPILVGAGVLMLLGLALAYVAPNMAILATIMPTITNSLTGLIAIIPQVLMLSLAISSLAISLAMLGTMGALALPVLAALSGGAGLLSILGIGGEKKGESSSDKLLEEIIGLRKDLNEGKVSVHLDGKKVNTGLAINQRRNIN